MFRNGIVVGAVFSFLAYYSLKFPAQIGPAILETADYVPRPGPQFLWLFEMQKYTDGTLAALLALGFPSIVFGTLIMAPVFLKSRAYTTTTIRNAVLAVFVSGIGVVFLLTSAAVYQDSSDSRIRKLIATQEKAEARFRAAAFKPLVIRFGLPAGESGSDIAANQDNKDLAPAPKIYVTNCGKCHGLNGEGTTKYPELTGVTTREEDKLSDEDVVAIINDPGSFGLSADMPSFRDKLTEAEIEEIAGYIRSLK